MVVVFVRPLVAVFPRVGEIFDVQLFFLHIHINVCSLYEYAMSCVSVMYVHYTNMQYPVSLGQLLSLIHI